MSSTRSWRLAWVLLACAVTACGGLVEPFETLPSVLEAGDADDAPRIAVCYNKLFSTPEQVRAVAIEACGPKTEPQLVSQDLKLTCPLLTPARANFRCAEE
jgi:hypothetical protein